MDSGRSKSGLFLIELLIVIAVFAVCAAICVSLFAEAHLTAALSRDTTHAVNLARNAAEEFKATGRIEREVYYYDGEWNPVQDEDGAVFVLRMGFTADETLPTCFVTVARAAGESLISLTAAVKAGVTYG
jgi:prepilin-type N-terminal cleavage/methylation domain-containing protein